MLAVALEYLPRPTRLGIRILGSLEVALTEGILNDRSPLPRGYRGLRLLERGPREITFIAAGQALSVFLGLLRARENSSPPFYGWNKTRRLHYIYKLHRAIPRRYFIDRWDTVNRDTVNRAITAGIMLRGLQLIIRN